MLKKNKVARIHELYEKRKRARVNQNDLQDPQYLQEYCQTVSP